MAAFWMSVGSLNPSFSHASQISGIRPRSAKFLAKLFSAVTISIGAGEGIMDRGKTQEGRGEDGSRQ